MITVRFYYVKVFFTHEKKIRFTRTRLNVSNNSCASDLITCEKKGRLNYDKNILNCLQIRNVNYTEKTWRKKKTNKNTFHINTPNCHRRMHKLHSYNNS